MLPLQPAPAPLTGLLPPQLLKPPLSPPPPTQPPQEQAAWTRFESDHPQDTTSIALVLLLILIVLFGWLSTIFRQPLRACLEQSRLRQKTGRTRISDRPSAVAAELPPMSPARSSSFDSGGLPDIELSPWRMLDAIYKAAFEKPSEPAASESSCSSRNGADHSSTAHGRSTRATRFFLPLPGARVSGRADTVALNATPSSSSSTGARGNEGLQGSEGSYGSDNSETRAGNAKTPSGSATESKQALGTVEDWISKVLFPSNLAV